MISDADSTPGTTHSANAHKPNRIHQVQEDQPELEMCQTVSGTMVLDIMDVKACRTARRQLKLQYKRTWHIQKARRQHEATNRLKKTVKLQIQGHIKD